MVRKRVQNRVEEQKILIIREKHGDYYFIVNDEKDLHNACVGILIQRYEEGWYGTGDDIPLENKTGINDVAQIEALPEGSVKEEALKEYQYYERSVEAVDRRLEFFKKVKTAMAYVFDSKDNYWTRNQTYDLLVLSDPGCRYGIELEYPSKIKERECYETVR